MSGQQDGNNGDGTNEPNGDANANGTGDETGNGGSSGNEANGNGDGGNGGDGAGTGDETNGDDYGFEFDGPYDEARAKVLIDNLRAELKAAKAKPTKTVPAAPTETATNDTASTDSAALEELRKLRDELAEDKRASQFAKVAEAMGMRPEAIDMAYGNVKDEFEVGTTGVITNLSTVLESLKSGSGAFMFVPVTNGQQKQGSSGAGGSHYTNNQSMPSDDERAAAKAFNMSVEEYRAAAAKVGK